MLVLLIYLFGKLLFKFISFFNINNNSISLLLRLLLS